MALLFPDAKHTKYGVIGSRDFANKKLMNAVLSEYLPDMKMVISGGANGADKMSVEWARKNSVETLVFLPDHNKFKQAFHHRNRLIVEASEMVIAFWNGHSTGTKYTVDYAHKMKRLVRIVRF